MMFALLKFLFYLKTSCKADIAASLGLPSWRRDVCPAAASTPSNGRTGGVGAELLLTMVSTKRSPSKLNNFNLGTKHDFRKKKREVKLVS